MPNFKARLSADDCLSCDNFPVKMPEHRMKSKTKKFRGTEFGSMIDHTGGLLRERPPKPLAVPNTQCCWQLNDTYTEFGTTPIHQYRSPHRHLVLSLDCEKFVATVEARLNLGIRCVCIDFREEVKAFVRQGFPS
jgi:hypothetical protein